MKENNESYYYLADIGRNTKAFIKFVLRRWYLLLVALGIGAGIGTVLYYRQKPNYKAVTTFILEDKSSMGGGFSGLASQFGIDLGGMGGGGSLFSGDNIFDILKSRRIVYKVLLSKASADSTKQEGTLADVFLNLSGWREHWKEKELLSNLSFSNVVDEKSLSMKQDSVLNEIHAFLVDKAIKVDKYNKGGTIIRVQVTSTDPAFARQMASRLVDEASNLYLNLKTGTAQANIARMQRRSDSILYLLNRKTFASAAATPLDLNPGIKTAIVPGEIISRDKVVLSTLYSELTKNLEASKLLLSQQTPIFQLLDEPGILLKDQRKGLTTLIVMGIIGVGFIYILINLFVFVYRGVVRRSIQTSMQY